jgi:hypothetical protein
MSEAAIDPKVIDRLLKLNALAKDDGANENEANNATEMMQRIMREHNLTMAALEMAGKSSDGEGGKRAKAAAKGRAGYKYQQELMAIIAEVNFVHLSIKTDWNGRRWAPSGYNMIGREANVVSAQQTFDYLNQTMERLAREYVGGDPKMILSREAIGFKEGMADRLGKRLKQRHLDALAEQKRQAAEANAAARHPSAAPGTALMIVLEDVQQAEKDANEDFRLGREPGTSARKRIENEAEATMRNEAYWALGREMADVNDPELVIPFATKVAEEQAERFSIDPERLEALMRLAIELAMRWHNDKVAERAKHAKETPKQKADREAREERANRRYWNARDRENEERDRRRGSTHFRRGSEAGAGVGLDKQVNQGAPSSAGRLK